MNECCNKIDFEEGEFTVMYSYHITLLFSRRHLKKFSILEKEVKTADALILEFSASRTRGNKFLLFLSAKGCGILL